MTDLRWLIGLLEAGSMYKKKDEEATERKPETVLAERLETLTV